MGVGVVNFTPNFAGWQPFSTSRQLTRVDYRRCQRGRVDTAILFPPHTEDWGPSYTIQHVSSSMAYVCHHLYRAGLVIALRPQTPKHIRAGHIILTPANQLMEEYSEPSEQSYLLRWTEKIASLCFGPSGDRTPYLLIRSQPLIDCATGPGIAGCVLSFPCL
jgi:hypothetical protein